MRIIATGATSFIGRAVTRELLVGDHHVFAVVRPDSPGLSQLKMLVPEAEGKSGKRGECLTSPSFALKDIKKLESCSVLAPFSTLKSHSAPKGVAELWFHLGWEEAGSISRQNPHIQVQDIGYALDSLHTAAHLGCTRFLFCGFQTEYDIVDGIIGGEISCHPVSEYGKGKLEICHRAGEDAKTLGIDYIHAKIFSVYGPEDHPWSLMSTRLDTFFKGSKMEFGACTQQWSFFHVRDATRVLTGLLLVRVPAGVYNVAGEDTRSLKLFAEQVYQLCEKKDTCEYEKRPSNVEEVVSLVPDIRRLKEAAGFAQETSFEDGAKEMVRTYKENCL